MTSSMHQNSADELRVRPPSYCGRKLREHDGTSRSPMASASFDKPSIKCLGTPMPRVRVHNLAMSVDGYAAGPNQNLNNPLGVGGTRLHKWAFATRSGRQMHGLDGGDEDLDDQLVAQGDVGIGATIMGRNMFGPFADHGAATSGLAGGGTIRRTTTRCSCSPTTHVRPSPWRAGPRFISSTTVSRQRSSERSTPPTEMTSGSAGGCHGPAVPPRRPDRRHALRDRAHPARQR
jgi:hypothetical protein